MADRAQHLTLRTEHISRPLGAMEHLFWLMDQHSPVHFAVTAVVTGDTSPADWRYALDRLQERHELLSVAIGGAPRGSPYFRRVAAPIPLRIVEGPPERQWPSEVETELGEPFACDQAPLIRAVVVQGDGEAALSLIAHHSVADGMSLVFAIRDTLAAIAGGNVEVLPPTPSADQLIPAVTEPPGPAPEGEPPSPAKFRVRDGVPASVQPLALGEGLTACLKDRARSESTTVHCALAAALSVAGDAMAAGWHGRPIRILSPVNARAILDAGEHCGDYLGAVTNIFAIVDPEHFWDAARETAEQLKPARTIAGVAALNALVGNFLDSRPDVAQAADFAATAFASEALLSNLGALPYAARFGGLTLKSLWGPCVLPDFENMQAIGASAANGSICLVHTSRSPVEGLLPAMRSILSAACA